MWKRGVVGVVVLVASAAPVVLVPVVVPAAVQAHSGGLDGTGGHHCREAGFNSGKCAPLNSYHCHRSPCGEAAPATTARPTTTARPATTAPPPPPPTTTTTTSTTAPPTTSTTAPPPTTTASTTTSTTAPDTVPAGSSRPDDGMGAGGAVVVLAVLGGLGYGGYAVLRRLRAAS